METTTSLQERLFKRSIPWRVALGWVAVAVLATHYLAHPILNVALVMSGRPAMLDLEPLSLTDILALLGSPLIGGVADRLSKEE